ncbi:MAG: TniQ family protein [Rhizobiales bacterium]|nr:TniQ family protein [Hyphomicrobiales bacterium]
MKKWAIRTVGHCQFEISGQQGNKGSLVRSRVRVCPKCVIEDVQRSGRFGMYRRHFWHFLSVRTCAVHAMPLTVFPPAEYTIRNYDFVGQVEQNWRTIVAAANTGIERPETKLEAYVLQRLNGHNINAFLDTMPLHVATRLCEVLGFVLLKGPKRKISTGSDDDLWQAEQTGFEALLDGEAGLFAALDTLVTPMALRTVRHQSDFGAFFEWLRISTPSNGFAPLKNSVRDYIFRTYPFQKGYMVLGKPCPVASNFTVHGAWQTLGIQRKRMNRYLVGVGFASKTSAAQWIKLNKGLSADDIRDISTKMGNRLNTFEAQDVLNVSVDMLQLLRKSKIIQPKLDALDQVPKYDRRDLQQLLSKLEVRVSVTGRRHSEFVTITDAAKRVRCPSADIVKLILDGALTGVSQDFDIAGLAGFRVDLAELWEALPPLEMQGVIKGEASQLLRVTYPTVNYFIDDGILSVIRVRNPKSRQFLDAVCDKSIEGFQSRYVTLGQLAKRYRRASGPLGCHLEAKDVCPIETPQGI